MVAIFIITLFGCSDSMTQCDALRHVSVEARSHSECVSMARDLLKSTRVDYPTSAVDCVMQGGDGFAIATSEGAHRASPARGSGS